MAGTKYGSFAVGDANIDNVMLQLAGVGTGYCALTLTEMTTTNVPQIAAGSKIEVGGSLFKFDANETITGTPGVFDTTTTSSIGANFIRLVPSGSSITAEWTTTAPTWSDSKQGWYDGTGIKRYIPYTVLRDTAAQFIKITNGWIAPADSPEYTVFTTTSTALVDGCFYVKKPCYVTIAGSNTGTLYIQTLVRPSIYQPIFPSKTIGAGGIIPLFLTPGWYTLAWTPSTASSTTLKMYILSSISSISKTFSDYIQVI